MTDPLGPRARAPRKNKRLGRPAMSDPAETRAHILRTATAEFARGGFNETSASTISDASGLSTGMIYYYFESKAGLYAAVGEAAVAQLNDGIVTELAKRVAHVPDLRGRLQVLIEALEEYAQTDLDVHWISFGADVESSRSEVVAEVQKQFAAAHEKLFTTILRPTVDEPLTAAQAEQRALIEVISLGMWQFLVRPGGPQRLSEAVEAFRQAINGGLLEPTVAPPAR